MNYRSARLPGHNRTAEVAVAGRAGLPTSGIGAVVVNATVTQTSGPGFFALWPARTYRPTASSLNASHAGQTIASHAITPVSTAGFGFYTQNGAHLVVDITGWFTGTELAAPLPPHVPLTGVDGPPPTQPYTFSPSSSTGPVRWNPCQAIPYFVNLGGYDPSERATINEAVERLEAATGLPLVPAGDTTFMPTVANPSPNNGADREIVIALADEVQSDLVPGNIVGRADISFTSTIRAASVVVDMGGVVGKPDWSSTGVGPVLLHELAHAVGLGHVTNTTQLMNGTATATGPTTYAAGDLTGLWLLGAAQGCTG